MAEVNAKDLTTKTAPASTDSMLLFGTTTNEGAKITVDNLANNILERLATKTFPNQVGGSSAATILAQLATLNSNLNAKVNGAQAFRVDGNKAVRLTNQTGARPCSALVFGWGTIAIVGLQYNGFVSATFLTGIGTLSVDENHRLITYADTNREYVVICPSNYTFTVEDV